MNTHLRSDDLTVKPNEAYLQTKEGTLKARIGRTYRFEAAHRLPFVPEGHKCRNLHGHSYRVNVIIRGPIDERGFVEDFAELDSAVTPLIARLDHCLLNDVSGLENPTAEIIAAWLFRRIPNCESVRVYENDDCWAEIAS
jgi:6-pyruvoyltetrahydropterin/6-carboxytetrahydropterin synthase